MLDINTLLAAFAYAVLTGVFNLIFANKSQINEWAAANPRLAGLLKITRALGLDPQHLWAAGALIVKGRLPKVQTDPVAEKTDDTVRIIPGGPLLVLLFLAFAVHQQGCAAPLPIAPDVCSKVSLGTIVAGCDARANECVPGDTTCPLYLECKRAIKTWKDCP